MKKKTTAKAPKRVAPARRAKAKVAAPAKRETGRPSLYSDTMALAVCGWVAQGYTLRQIEALPNMPAKSTIIRWLGAHESFRDHYARAHETRALLMADEVIEIAEDGRNDWLERENKLGEVELVVNREAISRSQMRIQARQWLMEKMAPKRYGKQVAVTGKGGGPMQVQHLGDILDEIDGAGTGLPGDGRP